jgi:hypothetical protein
MKTQIVKTTMALIITAVVAFGAGAQNTPYARVEKKEFAVTPQTRFELINKYGNVNIVNRDDATLTIEATVKVNTRDKGRADEILKMVQITISQEGDVIRAETEMDEDLGKIFKGMDFGNNGLEINYNITMPRNVPMNLSNKYGNVFIDEVTATSTLEIKYGKLSANRIVHDAKEPLTKVYLSYSNGTIQEAKWIELDIKYSKITITESKALAIMSKYSKVYVTNGTSIVCESKYDTYEIGKLNNFITTAAYGHFTISQLTGKLQVDTKYSDLIIDKIPVGFEGIKISNSYGTYKLGIDPGASYKLDGYSKYCTISYPDNARVNRFDQNNELKVNGTIGSNSSPTAEVTINSSYGNVKLIP